ncbi:chromosomal replication initiator protein DnaA [bacterium]|nr:chromosomal replication initiator protein DnaA [bacterium]|tara:strand:+ start:3359 stop:4711 length:1353 start_codon:yes stop_codon:yes gene_type:complete
MLSDQELWQNTLVHIEMDISEASFRTWFKDTVIVKHDNDVVYIGVPNKIVKDWLQEKHHKVILKTLRGFDGSIRGVEYVVTKHAAKKAAGDHRQIQSGGQNQLLLQDMFIDKRDNLNPRYTFDSFIVGPFNQLAHAAAQAVIQNPGLSYNPLFIYGGTGHGKTHLIQAVGNYLKKTNSNRKVFYVTSERFAMDYVNAVKSGKANNFKDKYRQYDVLIFDDVQFIADKERTQEELFHLFNALYDNNKQIVFSSDKHPNSLLGLTERLKGRFSAGMVAEIPNPDVESRMEILKEKANQNSFGVSDEVLQYIAKEVPGNIRELEGLLNTLICKTQLKGKELSTQEVQNVVKHTTKPNKNISVADVVKKVSEYYEVEEQNIYKKTRKKEVVRPRQVIMYILREDFGISYPSIGEKLGGRDHTTVIHSCEKVKNEIKSDTVLDQEINHVRTLIHN